MSEQKKNKYPPKGLLRQGNRKVEFILDMIPGL